MTTFVGIIDRPEILTIDGYSSAKTINGVMHDIARLMKSICPHDVQTFITKGKQEAIDLLDCTPKGSEGGFFVEVEETSCASRINEDTDKMEYKEWL